MKYLVPYGGLNPHNDFEFLHFLREHSGDCDGSRGNKAHTCESGTSLRSGTASAGLQSKFLGWIYSISAVRRVMWREVRA